MMHETEAPVVGLFSDFSKLLAAEKTLREKDSDAEIQHFENITMTDLEKSEKEELDFWHFMKKLFAFQTEDDTATNSKLRAYFYRYHPEKRHVLIVKHPRDRQAVESFLHEKGAVMEDLSEVASLL